MLRAVADPDYDAKLERAIVFHIEAWDSNCPQHIRPRWTVEELGVVGLPGAGRSSTAQLGPPHGPHGLRGPEEAFRRHDAQARLSPSFDRPC